MSSALSDQDVCATFYTTVFFNIKPTNMKTILFTSVALACAVSFIASVSTETPVKQTVLEKQKTAIQVIQKKCPTCPFICPSFSMNFEVFNQLGHTSVTSFSIATNYGLTGQNTFNITDGIPMGESVFLGPEFTSGFSHATRFTFNFDENCWGSVWVYNRGDQSLAYTDYYSTTASYRAFTIPSTSCAGYDVYLMPGVSAPF
jgi:hypothetical protein